jgi:mono/diheme cytochrome c family protein
MLTASLGTGVWAVRALSRATPVEAAAAQAPAQPTLVDGYQRSADLYTYTTSAKSGPQRGEELYFIKCWFCHNQWAKTGPTLKGLYNRPRMLTGQPVNDRTVAEKTRVGGPLMPAYRYALTEADMADLLAYIKSPQCCFEAEDPPPNPRYRLR